MRVSEHLKNSGTAGSKSHFEAMNIGDLEDHITLAVWKYFPGRWPQYLSNMLYLFDHLEETPLAGWHTNNFLEWLREPGVLRKSLMESTPTPLLQKIKSGLDPIDLTGGERRTLFRLWISSLEPIAMGPPGKCREPVSRGQLPIPLWSGGMVDENLDRDRFYEAIRDRFVDYLLESERRDVFVVNLGHGFFDEELRIGRDILGSDRRARPRQNRGLTRQIWWYFVQPAPGGMVICWPDVTVTDKFITWTIYVAACSDQSWQVCQWANDIDIKEVTRVDDLAHRKELPRFLRCRFTEAITWRWRNQVVLSCRPRFPKLGNGGWSRTHPWYKERQTIETTQAKELGAFVSDLMSRAIADYSLVTNIADFVLHEPPERRHERPGASTVGANAHGSGTDDGPRRPSAGRRSGTDFSGTQRH